MKVFINGRFLSQQRTGVQRYALETLLALDESLARSSCTSRVDVVVLAPRGTPAPPLSRIEFVTSGPFSGPLWEQVTLPAACGNSLLINFGMTGPLVKTNQVVTLHDASVYAVPMAFGNVFRTWYHFALPTLARRCRYLMTVSQFSQLELVRYLGPNAKRSRVTGEGWQHLMRVRADSSVMANLGLNAHPYVLAVGSRSRHKNLDLIARAIELVGDDLNFDVVVVGPCDRAIFSECKVIASSRLKHLGYVTDGELRALYEHATAFVHASYYEGFGIPPLEAMALGCPVLTSHAAAIPEVCGDGAAYFDPNDARSLAELLRAILTNPAQRDLLRARGVRQAQRHSWDMTARHFLAAIEEAANEHGRASVAPHGATPMAAERRL